MRLKKLTTIMAATLLSANSFAGSILLTEFDTTTFGSINVYDQMQLNLEAAGHTVERVDATVGGALASMLGTNSYDQVFLWDLTSTAFLDTTDVSALASFWDLHSGLVVDTRSYGHYFQGDNASEVALLQNVAANLDASGGGVWVGSDHDPSWTQNANLFLNEININPITGSFSDPVNFADPTSVLLAGVTPTDLWGAGATVGSAPVGIQPNGVDMFIHFGYIDGSDNILPYISASFDLEGVVPQVSAPATIVLFGLTILGLTAYRRKLTS